MATQVTIITEPRAMPVQRILTARVLIKPMDANGRRSMKRKHDPGRHENRQRANPFGIETHERSSRRELTHRWNQQRRIQRPQRIRNRPIFQVAVKTFAFLLLTNRVLREQVRRPMT